MRRTRVKICGVKTVEMAQAVAAAGADAVGLNFVSQSPRYAGVETAREIVAALPAFVEPVGLFVDESPERVLDVAKQVGLRTVQLHGQESVGYVESLAPLKVIKAIAFDARTASVEVTKWNKVKNVVGILWDTPPQIPPAPTGVKDKMTGGSGVRFNWGELAKLDMESDKVMILAGGLDAGNVGEAIEVVGPWAVDVSSGVESERGVKDAGMIEDFMKAVRMADGK